MLQDAIGVVTKEEMGVVLAGVGVMVVFWYMYPAPTLVSRYKVPISPVDWDGVPDPEIADAPSGPCGPCGPGVVDDSPWNPCGP